MGEFQGLIDLIAMKALYFKTEDLGSTVTEAEIPEDLRPDAELWRERMLDALADFDEPFAEAYMAHLEGAELTEEQIVAGAPAGHPDRPGPAGPLRLELQVRRRPAAARRRRRLPAQPARPAAGRRPPPQEGDRGRPQARPRRAVLRPGLQDHQRRPRRPLVRPHLLGRAEGRAAASTTPARDKKENCSRLYHIRADDREKVERGRRRRHRRRRRPEGLGHRRHPLRRRAPDPAGADRVPRDRHQHVDRARQLGRQGEARRHPGGRWPARTRPSPTRSTRRPARR